VIGDYATELADQMKEDAANPELPSLVSSTFSVSEWQGVQVSDNTATAQFLGAYTNCFAGGSFSTTTPECDPADVEKWQVTLRKGDDMQWRIVEMNGSALEISDITGGVTAQNMATASATNYTATASVAASSYNSNTWAPNNGPWKTSNATRIPTPLFPTTRPTDQIALTSSVPRGIAAARSR
jgi:hypothetical protein